MVREGLIDPDHFYGTINCCGVNARGDVCGVTTTSGLAWKIPGRVGDSPILGAGLYVDGDVGAAGSTGRGEANLYGLCSFLIVELMRQGKSPKDAGLEALRRIQSQHGGEAAAQRPRPAELQRHLLRAQSRRRLRQRLDVSDGLTRSARRRGRQIEQGTALLDGKPMDE